MEGREEEQMKGMNLKVKTKEAESTEDTSREKIKRRESYHVSPRSRGGSATAKSSRGGGGTGSNSGRFNCLCAPTTHAGSFRCRYHRLSGALPRGSSVPANLAMMVSKSDRIGDSLKAQ